MVRPVFEKSQTTMKLPAKFLAPVMMGLVAAIFFTGQLPAAETVAPDRSLPQVHLIPVRPRAAEHGTEAAILLILRTGPTNVALEVTYAIGGSAQNEVDYQPLLGSITIPAGLWAAPLQIVPLNDTHSEPRETVVITLTHPSSTNRAYHIAWPGIAQVVIVDDDNPANPAPSVHLINPPRGSVVKGPLDLHLAAVAEDINGFVKTVEFFANEQSLGIATNRLFSVDPSVLVDAVALPEAVATADTLPVFDAGTSSFVSGGSLLAPPIAPFHLTWSNAPPGEHQLRAVATDNGGVRATSAPVAIRIIADVELTEVNVIARDPIASEGNPASGELDTGVFVIRRSGSVSNALDVFVRLSGNARAGTDYRELGTTVTIPAGQHETEVVLVPVDDSDVEGPEQVRMSLLPSVCIDVFPPPPGCYQIGPFAHADVHIRDNDSSPTNLPPLVQIVHPATHSVFTPPADILLVAQARDPDGQVMTVEFLEGDRSLGVLTNTPLFAAISASVSIVLPPWTLLWTNAPIGLHVIRARAIDNHGAETISRPVEIRAVNTNTPPVVSVTTLDNSATEPLPAPPPTGGGSGSSTTVSGVTITLIQPPSGGTQVGIGDINQIVIGAAANAPAIRPATLIPVSADTAAFRISRSGPTDAELKVNYLMSGRAVNNVDYERLTGVATIPVGSTATDVIVVPKADGIPEGPENVILQLHPPIGFSEGMGDVVVVSDRPLNEGNTNVTVGAVRESLPVRFDYILGREHRAEIVIIDHETAITNHPPRVGIVRPADNSVTETGHPVGVLVSVFDPDDFSGRVVLRAGNQVIAERNGVSFQRNSELVAFHWTNPPAGSHVLAAIAIDNHQVATTSAPVNIRIIQPPRRSVVSIHTVQPRATEDPTSNGATNAAVFVVRREGGDLSLPLTVHYRTEGTAINGEDYQRLPGEIAFAANETERRIVIVPIDDDRPERAEFVALLLVPPVCAAIEPPPPGCYLVGQPGKAVAEIIDNDEARNEPPHVSIASPRNAEHFAEPAAIDILVHAQDPDGWVSQMEFYNGSVKLGDSVVHYIQPPEPGQRQRFTFDWRSVPAGEHTLRTRATDERGAASWSDPVRVIVRATNATPVVNVFAKISRAREGSATGSTTDTAVFRFVRKGSTNAPLPVPFAKTGSAHPVSDYSDPGDSVVIPAGSSSVDLLIRVVDDTEIEHSETIVIGLLPTVAQNPIGYEIGLHSRAAAVILDNDRVPVPGETNQPPARGESLAGGVVQVTLPGIAGEAAQLEGSLNLIDWYPIFSAPTTNAVIEFLDADALSKPATYYRVRPVNIEAPPVGVQRRF